MKLFLAIFLLFCWLACVSSSKVKLEERLILVQDTVKIKMLQHTADSLKNLLDKCERPYRF